MEPGWYAPALPQLMNLDMQPTVTPDLETLMAMQVFPQPLMSVPNLPPGYTLNYIPVLSPIALDADGKSPNQSLETLSTTPPVSVVKTEDLLATLSQMIDEAQKAKERAAQMDWLSEMTNQIGTEARATESSFEDLMSAAGIAVQTAQLEV